jgi:hypothetical protein
MFNRKPLAPRPAPGATFVEGGRTYVLAYDLNLFVDIEAEAGISFARIAADLTSGDPQLHLLRTVLRVGLKTYQPTITTAEAGALMFRLGRRLGPLIGEALLRAGEVVEGA